MSTITKWTPVWPSQIRNAVALKIAIDTGRDGKRWLKKKK